MNQTSAYTALGKFKGFYFRIGESNRRDANSAPPGVSTGWRVNKKFSKHQTKRAYSVLKEGAIHAFQHGGDFDEMVTILREALTEVVMSS